MSTPTRRKSAASDPSSVLTPVAGPRPTREELEAMCLGLPAQTRGVDECWVRLNFSRNFVNRHLKAVLGMPPMPHFPMEDGKHIFNTGLVMTWLYQWFRPGTVAETMRGARGVARAQEAREQEEGAL